MSGCVTRKVGPLELVCTEASRGEHWWVMNLLLDHGANVNEPSRDGETSLATICRNTCERPLWVRLFLVQRLVQRGADVDGRDSRGQTPIMITYKDQKHTQGDRFCIIERLLELGANVLAKDTSGNSFMDLICATGSLGEDERVELLSLLLRYHPNKAVEKIHGIIDQLPLHKPAGDRTDRRQRRQLY